MKIQPLYDSTTHYRIEVQGRVDMEWLQSYEISVEIFFDDTRQVDDVTLLDVHTDQSGVVGLLRRLHGLGMTIQQVQIVCP